MLLPPLLYLCTLHIKYVLICRRCRRNRMMTRLIFSGDVATRKSSNSLR
ncbi:unnamed protein product, partial [Allacma fusca]